MVVSKRKNEQLNNVEPAGNESSACDDASESTIGSGFTYDENQGRTDLAKPGCDDKDDVVKLPELGSPDQL